MDSARDIWNGIWNGGIGICNGVFGIWNGRFSNWNGVFGMVELAFEMVYLVFVGMADLVLRKCLSIRTFLLRQGMGR